MIRTKLLYQKITLTIILTLAFTGSISYSSLGQTQPEPNPPDSHLSDGQERGAGSHVDLPPLPDDAPSGNRKGAASHGPCQADETLPSLTAIVPKWQDRATGKTYVRGGTTSAYPTFWFYVPYQAGTHAEFVLQDKEQYPIYQTSFELVGIPGVISFTLPATQEAALTTENDYFWYFKITCDPQGSTDDFATGWVSRIEPSPELDENNMWHDALTNLDTVSADLLQRAGLSDLEPQPIVQQYKPSQ